VDPECLYECWDHSDDQEDAEEFLRLILNGLHEELMKHKDKLGWDLPTMSKDLKSISKQTVEDEWFSIKKGQKAATSRQLLEPPSPISVLFNGQLKSIVRQKSKRESHVYEPFQFLPLEVNNDSTDLEDAIKNLMKPEILSPTVSRQLLIDRLPPILVLQLKRFIFDPVTCSSSKSLAHVQIPMELDLASLVDNHGDFVFFKDDEAPIYRLTAVIYHLGRSIQGGHYTCHVWHDDVWYFCDDGCINTAPREVVGKTDRNRTPYLLFYTRIKKRNLE
jgi:ubiquitin carboxyl-terminal hydrolase 10